MPPVAKFWVEAGVGEGLVAVAVAVAVVVLRKSSEIRSTMEGTVVAGGSPRSSAPILLPPFFSSLIPFPPLLPSLILFSSLPVPLKTLYTCLPRHLNPIPKPYQSPQLMPSRPMEGVTGRLVVLVGWVGKEGSEGRAKGILLEVLR